MLPSQFSSVVGTRPELFAESSGRGVQTAGVETPAGQLFGRSVLRQSVNSELPGQRFSLTVLQKGFVDFGEAVAPDFDQIFAAGVPLDVNRFGLQVAQHYAVEVRRVNRAANLIEDIDCRGETQPALLLHQVAQRASRQKFLDDVGRAIRRMSEVEDLDRIRMLDARGDLSLTAKALECDLVFDQFRPQDSHGDIVVERRPARAVKRAGRIL